MNKAGGAVMAPPAFYLWHRPKQLQHGDRHRQSGKSEPDKLPEQPALELRQLYIEFRFELCEPRVDFRFELYESGINFRLALDKPRIENRYGDELVCLDLIFDGRTNGARDRRVEVRFLHQNIESCQLHSHKVPHVL